MPPLYSTLEAFQLRMSAIGPPAVRDSVEQESLAIWRDRSRPSFKG
jgi:hypothetical protein